MLTLSALGHSLAAGTLVAFSPCVLPALPLIASGAAASRRSGPLWVALGLVMGFTGVGVSVAAFGHLLGLSPDTLRQVGAVFLILAGAVLCVHTLETRVSALLSPLASWAASRSASGSGRWHQVALGGGLGLVWAPCSGPALGAALGLATQAGGLIPASALMLMFGIGAAIPLVLAAYGTRALFHTMRHAGQQHVSRGKRLLGILLLGVGLLTLTGGDHHLIAMATDRLPSVWLDLITRL